MFSNMLFFMCILEFFLSPITVTVNKPDVNWTPKFGQVPKLWFTVSARKGIMSKKRNHYSTASIYVDAPLLSDRPMLGRFTAPESITTRVMAHMNPLSSRTTAMQTLFFCRPCALSN